MRLHDGEFHANDGVIFRRDRDGGVTVLKAGESFGERETLVELTASAWASIVAHVSARGETGET